MSEVLSESPTLFFQFDFLSDQKKLQPNLCQGSLSRWSRSRDVLIVHWGMDHEAGEFEESMTSIPGKRSLSDEERYLAEQMNEGNLQFCQKLILGGGASSLVGIFFLVDAFALGFLDPIIGGLWWKGAILVLAGIGAIVMGLRKRANVLQSRKDQLGY